MQALDENRLRREMNNLTQTRLLVLDEVSYLALGTTQASPPFQVLCERYDRRRPVVLTCNKAFVDLAHAPPATR